MEEGNHTQEFFDCNFFLAKERKTTGKLRNGLVNALQGIGLCYFDLADNLLKTTGWVFVSLQFGQYFRANGLT
jgi:hypothetical protein